MRFARVWAPWHPNWVLAVAALILVAGCASVPMAPPQESDAAKGMVVPPGKALIYLYRSAMMGAAVKFDVEVNGQPIGSTIPQSFFLIEAPPGEVRLVSQAQNTAELKLTVEAGKRYYVIQNVEIGFVIPRTSMDVVHEQRGREGVAGTNLIRHVKL